VQMRRLQRRLADYYDHEGVADDVLIALPETGFLPVLTGRPGRRTHIRPAGRHSHGRR
jgi:hypothetical protein